MSQVHPCARTTPRTRAEINASPAGATALACRYNITVATARKWKGREDSQDRSHRLGIELGQFGGDVGPLGLQLGLGGGLRGLVGLVCLVSPICG